MTEGIKKFDVIIIGGGAAGLSAALWCDELGLSCLLLEAEAEFGGQLLRVYNRIENHLGIEARNGRYLRDCFVRQTENRGFIRRLETKVSQIDAENKNITLPDGEELSAKTLIIATGVRRRKLNVEGEEFFRGRGIIESGKKDAAAVAGKTVLIVGGGDAALENALILAETAKKVYLAHRRRNFRGRTEFLEKILPHPKIKIFTESAVRRIVGGESIEAVEIQNLKNNEIQNLPIEVVLIRIGVAPNSEIVRGKVDLDADGYIKINSNCETSVKRIFAVGDVANPLAPTVSSAVGTGATAAKAISALLNS
ncbi:MAG: NAD(P)/FAD-dependent oxidoreductase [Acidobacteriota bacterium]|nr:NAD(P)/FAD-dependent oxidoreductase [Acidobacteriota bacterium]